MSLQGNEWTGLRVDEDISLQGYLFGWLSIDLLCRISLTCGMKSLRTCSLASLQLFSFQSVIQTFRSGRNMFNLNCGETMKKETWKLVIQLLLSVLTALGTTLGVTSCAGMM